MKKTHKEYSTLAIIDGVPVAVWYFYTREKRDINGNSRFRVFVSDPDAAAVHETIFKCYESQIGEYVKMFVERAAEQC